MKKSLLRVLLCCLTALSVFSAARGAEAQAIALPVVFTRKQPFRNQSQQPNWVNRADCLADDQLTFPTTLTGYQNYTLQVWASVSVDCTQITARFGAAAQCWPLYSAAAQTTPVNVLIDSRALVAEDVLLGSSATSTLSGVPAESSDVCNKTGLVPTQLTLYFMLVDGANNLAGSAATWTQTGYDISPPGEPTGVSGSQGDTRIHLSWTDPLDTDVYGYNFYCDPPPGPLTTGNVSSALATPDASLAGLIDAGSSGGANGTGGASSGVGGTTSAGGTSSRDAGFGGSTTEGGVAISCLPGSIVKPGGDPGLPNSPLANHYCGSATGILANNGEAKGLVDYHEYAVGVAAVDNVGNIGQISNTVCIEPVELIDFFQLYRQDGGGGGGGLCSMSRKRATPAWGLSLLGLCFGVGALRRLRRRS